MTCLIVPSLPAASIAWRMIITEYFASGPEDALCFAQCFAISVEIFFRVRLVRNAGRGVAREVVELDFFPGGRGSASGRGVAREATGGQEDRMTGISMESKLRGLPGGGLTKNNRFVAQGACFYAARKADTN